jgi:hypothetical protein
VFRTSLKAVVLASAIFVGGALTACQPVRPGAAATVGGQRITTSQLDSVVADWRKEFARNADAGQVQQQLQQQGQPIPFDPDSPVRSALYQLVEMRVWDEVARQKGIGVTQGQIDERIARGGGGRTLTAQLLAGDLPSSYSRAFVRSDVIVRTVAQQAGVVLDAQSQVDQQRQQQGLRQVQETYLAAARSLHVKINPRYGAFDLRQGGMTAVTYRLSRTGSGTG